MRGDPKPLDLQLEGDRVRAKEVLERLLASETFARSTQLQRFLQFTVEETLAGRSDDIKEYSIAVEAYGRPPDFDPRADASVRTEARRLREKLDAYYETDGTEDPVRILFPKGGYAPTFFDVDAGSAGGANRIRAILAVAGLGIAVVGASAVWISREPEPRVPRVAVMPFEDRTAGEEGLALAMSESVLAKLTRTDGVVVLSRTSIFRVRDSPTSLRELAAGLDADYVVGGDVERLGDSLRLTARLVRANDEKEVWTESFDFSWFDVFEAQDQLSARLVEQLRLTAAKKPASRTPTVEAYEAYVKGRFSAVQFANTRSQSYFEDAKRRLESAVALDPDLAEAWASLGVIQYHRLYPPQGDRAEILEESRTHLERALQIDPANVTALYMLGVVNAQSGRHVEGIELCRKAIREDPGEPRAHEMLGQIYEWLGFYESAIAKYDEAIAQDPLYLTVYANKTLALSNLGRFPEALATIRGAQERAPDNPYGDFYLGEVYYRMGDAERAESIWRERYQSLPKAVDSSFYEAALAHVATEKGDLTEGRRVLEEYRGSPYREQTHLTEIAALLHETDYAVERIAGHPQRNYRWLVSAPALTKIAGEPAFVELTRSLYAHWLSDLEALGRTLPERPPALPNPEEFLRLSKGSDGRSR